MQILVFTEIEVKLNKPEFSSLSRNVTDLFFQGHDEDAPHLQQVLHVVLVLLLHAGAAVDPVVLAALRRNLQAVASNKRRLTELKPEEKHQSNMYMNIYSVYILTHVEYIPQQ